MPGKTSSYNLVFSYLEKAYALLVPSRFDNFPTVIIEAFSSGVPVIGSNAGGIPEMIKQGVDGFICEPDNEQEWIDKIELLIKDVNLRNKMALQARRSYEEKFTMEKHVGKVTDFLSSLK